MREIRCPDCRRKLAEGEFKRLEIKCPRCGVVASFQGDDRPTRERQRASQPGERCDARKKPHLMGGWKEPAG
ncbi:MAG: Com family DNA-binding transcriptional regulator [Burkholderiales bacterium]|nr:Com family DNA-binding transcriptional regulator [Burkholderiales bacterium]